MNPINLLIIALIASLILNVALFVCLHKTKCWAIKKLDEQYQQRWVK